MAAEPITVCMLFLTSGGGPIEKDKGSSFAYQDRSPLSAMAAPLENSGTQSEFVTVAVAPGCRACDPFHPSDAAKQQKQQHNQNNQTQSAAGIISP